VNTDVDSFSFDLLVILDERRDMFLMAAVADVKGMLGPGV